VIIHKWQESFNHGDIMKKTIQVTVTYPVSFKIEIDDSLPKEQIIEQIKDRADYYLTSSTVYPSITESTDKTLIEE